MNEELVVKILLIICRIMFSYVLAVSNEYEFISKITYSQYKIFIKKIKSIINFRVIKILAIFRIYEKKKIMIFIDEFEFVNISMILNIFIILLMPINMIRLVNKMMKKINI